MSLMLRLQALAIVVGMASMVFVHIAAEQTAPAWRVLAFDLSYGAFILWWAGSIAWKRWRGVADDTPDGWYPHTLTVFWLGNLATAASFWLMMPFADEGARLMVTMMCLAPVTVEVMGSVRSPAYGRPGLLSKLAPLGIPAGLLLWFAGSKDSYALPVMLFLPAYCGAALLLREFLQGAVDQAYAAKAEAEAARDAKARFLAAASHDLGQPLQAARLFFDQVSRARSPPEQRAAEERVNWAFASMEHQVRQILDHLRLEAREVRADVRDVALAAVVARVAELHEPAARLAQARIVAVATGLTVQGDPVLIERALSNYLANAIRHATARRILVGARRAGPVVRLWVIDDGRGVSETEREALFVDYAQGEWSGRGEVRGGFGLGLASVRRMAELMGGAAGHDPRWRGGGAFWLELPRGGGLAS